jgi:hypothetical protein
MVFGIIPECRFGFPSEKAFSFAGIPILEENHALTRATVCCSLSQ